MTQLLPLSTTSQMEAVIAAAIQAGARRKGPWPTSGRAGRPVSHRCGLMQNIVQPVAATGEQRRCGSTANGFRHDERRLEVLAPLNWRRWQIQF